MYVAYFGEFVGMGEKPSIVPYTKIDQPGGRPDEIRTNFLLPKSLHEKIVKKPLDLDKIWIRRHVVEMNKMRMYLENILRSFKSDRYKVIFNHLRHIFPEIYYYLVISTPINLILWKQKRNRVCTNHYKFKFKEKKVRRAWADFKQECFISIVSHRFMNINCIINYMSFTNHLAITI